MLMNLRQAALITALLFIQSRSQRNTEMAAFSSKSRSGSQSIRLLILAMAATGLFTCSSDDSGFKRSLTAFSGFAFVGSRTYKGQSPESQTLPEHGTTPLTLPMEPSIGIEYIFRHKRPINDEKLALVDLPAALRAAGVEITRSPRSIRDMVSLFVSGPLFKIDIKDGRHRGMIYNQIDADLLKSGQTEWVPEDYFLIWTM